LEQLELAFSRPIAAHRLLFATGFYFPHQ